MKVSRNVAVVYSATILYAALIFYISSTPGTTGIISGWYLYADKVDHVLEYAILGALLYLSFHLTPLDYAWVPERCVTRREKESFSTFVLGVLYGVSDETHQFFVEDRVASVFDVGADAVGVLLGIYIVIRYLEYRAGSSNSEKIRDDETPGGE